MPSFQLQNGTFLVNNAPKMLLSADYPYYRDDPQNWAQRLTQLRDVCHVDVVTFYIPWRHHQPTESADYDFTGQTQPNRNVIAFVQQVHQLGLWALAKPGPFIHAETNFGGLPDWLSPTHNPAISAWQNAQGQANTWSSAARDSDGFISGVEQALPAPFDPIFLAATRAWLRSVGQAVITPHLHPNGPIVAVQIANEGVYSDGQAPVWDYDYSPSALSIYRRWLQTQYADLDAYNARHGTEHDTWDEIDAPRAHPGATPTAQQTAQYHDWGSFSAHYLGEIYTEWLDALNVNAPTVVNLNPPVSDPHGTDAWLARVEPERYPQVHYGFTNWIGDVSADASAFDRYLLTAKRARGANYEENWGFSQLYDASYVEPATSYFQTLLALAGGATGCNLYTGVNTAAWDDHLDALHERPYPDASPIREDGSASYKATIAGWLNRFLKEHGEFMLTARPNQPCAFGLVQAHCYASMWQAAPTYGPTLNQFQRLMHAHGLDYGIVSLDHATAQELARWPMVVLARGDDLSSHIRQTLKTYQTKGGRVYILGDHSVPGALSLNKLEDILPALAHVPRPVLTQGRGTAWMWQQDDEATLIVLIPKGDTPFASFNVPFNQATIPLTVKAAPASGAILHVKGRHILSALCKGVNDWVGVRVKPSVRWENRVIELDTAGDFLFLKGQLHTGQP
ncbi:beta-galactosidase (plasmid) [Aggregatilineales bacterium SYSU G02658]